MMILNKRTDIVSGNKFDKKDLIRIVKQKNGEIVISEIIKGRGAYVSRQADVNVLLKKKVLNKAFRTPVDLKIYEELIKKIKEGND